MILSAFLDEYFRALENVPRVAEEEAKRQRREQARREVEEMERIKMAAPVKVAIKIGMTAGIGKKTTTKTAIFSGATDEVKQPRAIIPIDFTDEEKAAPGMQKFDPSAPSDCGNKIVGYSEAKIEAVANLIPIEKDDLFNYSLDWTVIKKHGILDQVIKPWVSKKVEEYLGENEETLCSFILSKLVAECSPRELLGESKLYIFSHNMHIELIFMTIYLSFCSILSSIGELEVVLDSDAEKFVIKLQQLLIFQSLEVSYI